MKVIHTISVARDNGFRFEALGFRVTPGLVAMFDVAEDDERWPSVLRVKKELNEGTDMVRTVFSRQEILQAAYIKFSTTIRRGYPAPQDVFDYMTGVYDTSRHCQRCGVGAVQIGPLRLSRNPRWSCQTIGQIYWVSDAYFCSMQLWEKVFRPLTVGYWPVLKADGHTKLEGLIQLKTEDSPVSLRISGGISYHPQSGWFDEGPPRGPSVG